MSHNRQEGSITRQIMVAIVVALLVGGSAPWWWGEIFPGEGPPASPPVVITEQPPSSSENDNEADDPAEESPSGCVITIANPLVALKSEPDTFSQDLIAVPPGEYDVLNYNVQTDPGGNEKGWFQIDVDSRTGWVPNDIFSIAGKSDACP